MKYVFKKYPKPKYPILKTKYYIIISKFTKWNEISCSNFNEFCN